MMFNMIPFKKHRSSSSPSFLQDHNLQIQNKELSEQKNNKKINSQAGKKFLHQKVNSIDDPPQDILCTIKQYIWHFRNKIVYKSIKWNKKNDPNHNVSPYRLVIKHNNKDGIHEEKIIRTYESRLFITAPTHWRICSIFTFFFYN